MNRDRQFISQVRGQAGEQVVLHGWLSQARKAKDGYRFDLRDRSGSLPAFWGSQEATDDLPPPEESAVRVSGHLSAVNGSGVTLTVEDLRVLGRMENGPSRPKLSKRGPRHLELRKATEFDVYAIQTTLEAAMREFAIMHGFVELHTPKISGGGSESGASVFELDYFGRSAYLVQSPQFYMQLAMVAGFDRVFEIGPVFRSEPGKSPIHASEFTIAHFEMSWIESHRDLMDFEEELLRYAVGAVEAKHGKEIEEKFQMPLNLPSDSLPRLPVAADDGLVDPAGGQESRLASVEQALAKHAQKRLGHSATFLVDYPAAVRPFYTMQEGLDGGEVLLSRSFDLLWHGIEVTSGGQREHRFDRLEAQINEAALSQEICDDYIRPHFLEMFRDGAPPHGGFGIGVNRVLMALMGRGSVKETSFVFRGPGPCVP